MTSYTSTGPAGESPEQKAIRLLTRQLKELGTTICALNDDHHDFKAWRDTTREALERFLGPDSQHTIRFRDTRFYGPTQPQSDYPGVARISDGVINQIQARAFQKGCAAASPTLQAAIKHVDDYGFFVEKPKTTSGGRGSSEKRKPNPHQMRTASSAARHSELLASLHR